MPNSSVTTTRSDSALRHRWIALQKHKDGADGLGSAAKGLRTNGGGGGGDNISSSRKRYREQTSLSYDEIINRLEDHLSDGGGDVNSRIFELLGTAMESSVLLWSIVTYFGQL